MMSSLKLAIFNPLVATVGITGIIGIGLIVLGVLAPSWFPISKRDAVIAGIGCLIAGAAFWAIFNMGERHMAQKIAAKDNAAIQRVEGAKKDVEACNGGVDWDVTTGTCLSGDTGGGFFGWLRR